MRRREFITLLGVGAAWPLAAQAQQPTIPVVGFLDLGRAESNTGAVTGFRRGLAESGYVEGRNIEIDFRWANTEAGRLRPLAEALVRRQAAVIAAPGGFGSALAAKAATSTIPIVIAGGADPVKLGLVASLARPGGNVTGVTYIFGEIEGKQLELICRLVPSATIGYLVGDQRGEISREKTNDLKAVAAALGRQLMVLECRTELDFEAAFAIMVERRTGAVVVTAFPPAFNNRRKIVALAAHHMIPAIYSQDLYTYDGGLMSYSPEISLRYVASHYVARILRGTRPADLPVERPTKFRLVINLKTAKALALEIPPTLLALADEVIE